jgi:hypothetical protein
VVDASIAQDPRRSLARLVLAILDRCLKVRRKQKSMQVNMDRAQRMPIGATLWNERTDIRSRLPGILKEPLRSVVQQIAGVPRCSHQKYIARILRGSAVQQGRKRQRIPA